MFVMSQMITALLNNSAKLRYHPFRTKVRFVIAWKSFLSNPSFAPLNPVRILWSEEQSSLDGWCDKYELLKRVENNFAFYWKIFVPGSQTLCLLPNTQRRHRVLCFMGKKYYYAKQSAIIFPHPQQYLAFLTVNRGTAAVLIHPIKGANIRTFHLLFEVQS